MADRFPSLEDFSAGQWTPFLLICDALAVFFRNAVFMLTLVLSLGQTETRGNGTHDTDDNIIDDDFLTRERAALGDDAAQFASPADNFQSSATVEDGEDDLLGGGGDAYTTGNAGGDNFDFENSFPAIDTNNSVRST